MTITGTAFGTDKTKVKVFLDKDVAGKREVVYELFILSVADTEIVATLSGGKVGDFFARVFIDGKGNNLNNAVQFAYVISITDFSPKSGSIYGGQVLTITGKHFSNQISDNYVYLQEMSSDAFLGCEILTASETQLTCRTPLKTA